MRECSEGEWEWNSNVVESELYNRPNFADCGLFEKGEGKERIKLSEKQN